MKALTRVLLNSRKMSETLSLPVTKKKKMPRAEREQQILKMAINLFIVNGYQGTSMENIAEAAGVTRPVIYNLFGVKDNIYLACLRMARENLDNRLSKSTDGVTDFSTALYAGIDNYFQFVEQDRQAWRLLFGGGAAMAGSASGEAARLRFVTVNKIADMLMAFAPQGDRLAIEMQAHVLSGAAEQLAKWWIENNQADRKTVVETLMRLLQPGFEKILP